MCANIRTSNNGIMDGSFIKPLQGLRVLAFMGIFLSHCGVVEWGPWGVSIFLVLSGFLMQYRNSDKDYFLTVKDRIVFAANKIKKNYFLHIVTMIAAIIVQVYTGKIFYSLSRSLIDCGIIGLHLLFLQAWIPRSGVYFSLNGVSWYLCVAVFCYFMFPVIQGRIKKYSSVKDAIKWIAAIYAVLALGAYLSTYINTPTWLSKDFTKWFVYVCPLFRVGDFAVGCNLAYIFSCISINDVSTSRNNANIHLYKIEWTFFELTFLAAGLLLPENKMIELGLTWFSESIVYLPVSACLVWIFARGVGYISNILAKSVFVVWGGLTQYTFLIHFQVVNDWQMFTHYNIYIDVVVSLVITMALSWLWMKFMTMKR